jgi:hypothetical protein
MTLKARVLNSEENAAKAIAETMATAVRAASLVASAARALEAREAGNAATSVAETVSVVTSVANAATSVANAGKDLVVLEPRVVKIAHAAILAGNAAKVLAAPEAVVISAVDPVAVVVSKEVAHPAKGASALVKERVLVLPEMGIGSPVRQTTKKTTSYTGFTR